MSKPQTQQRKSPPSGGSSSDLDMLLARSSSRRPTSIKTPEKEERPSSSTRKMPSEDEFIIKKPSTPSSSRRGGSVVGESAKKNEKLNNFLKYLEDVDKTSTISDGRVSTTNIPPSPSHSYISSNSSASNIQKFNLDSSMEDFGYSETTNVNPTAAAASLYDGVKSKMNNLKLQIKEKDKRIIILEEKLAKLQDVHAISDKK